MKCLNHQFGEVEYTDEHVYDFPEGIIGFEQLRKFIIIHDKESDPFRWLLSTEESDFCVPILDPKFIDPLYTVSNTFTDGTTVAVIVSLKDPLHESTVNLRSPLLIDTASHSGQQTILENDRYAIQHRFLSEPQLVTGE